MSTGRSIWRRGRTAGLLGLSVLLAVALAVGLRAVRSARAQQRLQSREGFDLPAPRVLTNPKTLWATWYWTPSYRSAGDIPLLDMEEKPLGPKPLGLRLPPESFCRAAVEGAVRMDGQVYTFAGLGPRKLTDCKPYWPTMTQAPYVRFEKSDSPYGEGVDDYDLTPYRTIAVDEAQIPIGTVLYIPRARGCLVTLPDGARVRHDGYFFAGDDGYGVHGNHIDVFLGISQDCPFPWVVSRPWGTFPAYVVTDPALIRALRRRLPPGEERLSEPLSAPEPGWGRGPL